MEEEMMQGGEAPMEGPAAPDMGPEEEQMRQAVMMIVEELIKTWKETGEIAGRKIGDEKEARKYAMGLAMQELQNQAQGGGQPAPPAGGQMGGGGAPPAGGAPMM